MKFPTLNNVRVDTGVLQGDNVSIHYDSMIAKIIAHGRTRIEAIKRLNQALAATYIGGVSSNINLVRVCLMNSQFQTGQISTGFIEQNKTNLLNNLMLDITKNNLLEGTAAIILFNVIIVFFVCYIFKIFF